jgi:hypothetical protein
MTTKNLTALLDRPAILSVLRRPGATVKVISHRLMRYLTPVFLLAMFGSNLLLLGQPLFRLALALQGACYVGALIGFIGDRAGRHVPLASTLFTFCLTNGGFLLWLWNVVRHRPVTYYEPIRE